MFRPPQTVHLMFSQLSGSNKQKLTIFNYLFGYRRFRPNIPLTTNRPSNVFASIRLEETKSNDSQLCSAFWIYKKRVTNRLCQAKSARIRLRHLFWWIETLGFKLLGTFRRLISMKLVCYNLEKLQIP